MSALPSLSIVTVSFNSARTISPALDSVLAQDLVGVELIVIDGASTDGTVEIVKSYGRQVHCFISEPDRGIYHAMNKGWQRSTGDIVAFLNSDDRYASNSVLSSVHDTFRKTNAGAVYGDLEILGNSGQVIRRWTAGTFRKSKYHLGWMTPHPSTFIKRNLFEKYGGFREDLAIAADYELMLRFFYRHQISPTYLPQTLVAMSAGGASTGSPRAILKANLEVYRSWRMNSLWTTPAIVALKPLSKLLQLRASSKFKSSL